ncbi:MAG TPA: PDZ domain-containing protein [Thermoanaerobaculia bacterium]|jgi:S1-C subfamily serine protease|nr:PDZ domain-containing protein [Thermoanaerobaculia bacterium]
MKKTVTLLALALTLALSAAVWAGGEQCDHAAHNAKTAAAAHGWLGIETDKAHTVVAVAAGSPAEKAGFRKGDVVLALNGVSMNDTAKAKEAHDHCNIGKTVTYTIQRGGAQQTLTATLAAAPAGDKMAQKDM